VVIIADWFWDYSVWGHEGWTRGKTTARLEEGRDRAERHLAEGEAFDASQSRFEVVNMTEEGVERVPIGPARIPAGDNVDLQG